MKTSPSRLTFKKYHKVNKAYLTSIDSKNFYLLNGRYALQAAKSGTLTWKQIEACRRTLRRGFGKTVKLYIRPFTSHPVTAKSVASRMGKGKGPISHWIAPIRKGQVLFEIVCSSKFNIPLVFAKAASRLPFKVVFARIRY